MGFRFKVLGSSSSGNCGLLQTNKSNFLIDAGFSGKKINQLLAPFGITTADINGVFITHEHTDHVLGLKTLSRIPSIRFFANYQTAEAIQRKHSIPIHWSIFDTGKPFTVEKLFIEPFLIPHDACEPVGFVFRSNTKTPSWVDSMAWLTDLGHVPEPFKEIVHDVQLLVMESNHDIELLKSNTQRPWSLKQRILSHLGHLSNLETYSFLESTNNYAWKKIFLAHISRDCNDISLVEKIFMPLALKKGFALEIVNPSNVQYLNAVKL